MNHIVSQRFISCYQELLKLNQIKSARQFALLTDCLPQTFHEILKSRRDVNLDLILKSVEVFNFNSNYLFTGTGPKLLKEQDLGDLKILTIVAGQDGKEDIVHVPMKAQAGYPGRLSDPVFMEDLPRFNLPDFKFKTDGTMRSFEVAGESMVPTLLPGDFVIASYLHSFYWESQLKSDIPYVLITNDDVLVKRLTNKLRSEHKILVHSDNKLFDSYAIHVKEIKEIWQVRAKVSTVLNTPEEKPEVSLFEIKNIMEQQNRMITEALSKL
jgi:phage repressor protein C with HTH and peptisase S24 domain